MLQSTIPDAVGLREPLLLDLDPPRCWNSRSEAEPLSMPRSSREETWLGDIVEQVAHARHEEGE